MTKRVDPLSYKIPIVDGQGRPTREFMRKWSQQAESNSGVLDLSTAAKVSAVLDKITTTVGAVLVRGATAWQGLPFGANQNANTFYAGPASGAAAAPAFRVLAASDIPALSYDASGAAASAQSAALVEARKLDWIGI